MSNVFYYQSNLDQFFKCVLVALGKSKKTITNYRSDFHHFISWVTGKYTDQIRTFKNDAEFLTFIQPEIIYDYLAFQTNSATPISTINRRLSAVRIFFSNAASHKLVSVNPALGIPNVNTKIPSDKPASVVAAFQMALTNEGAAKSTIRNYGNDVEQFLNWIDKSTQNQK